MIHRLISLNKPNDFNKRWHWLLGPWSAPPKRSLFKETERVGFQPVTCYQFYDLSSVLRIVGARLFSLIGFDSSKRAQYSGSVSKTGLLPSVILVEAQK